MRQTFRWFAVACGFCLIHPASALAQSQPINNLKDALPFVHWEARTHGPLIAIAPDKVKWEQRRDIDTLKAIREAEEQEPLRAPKDQYGLSADKVAQYFNRKLIRYPTLSIYAPPTMIVLNANLKPADPFLSAPIEDKLRCLGAILTDVQWKRLGSAEGLGWGDLTQEQQTLFDDILPEKMTIDRETTKQYDNGYIGTETVDGSEKTLSAEQRRGVRLHLIRQASFNLVDPKNNSVPIESPFHTHKIGEQRTALEGEVETFARQSTFFGQQVRYETPNRLKPSDLDLKQPLLQDAYVPLTGVKTVGDLLKAASAKTGLELHADNRLARLPVYVSTESRLVHASDLLEALCWALTATYRKVGPVPGGDPKDFAYVLTYDRVGLAATRGQIAAWARRGRALREQNDTHFDEAIQKQKPGQYVHYGKGDPLTPTDDALQALRSERQARASKVYDEDDPDMYNGGDQNTVPITALTAEQRQQMSAGLKQIDKMHADNPRFPSARTDRVSMWTSFGLSYLIPGVDEVRSDYSLYDGSGLDDEDPEIERRQAEAEKEQERRGYLKQIALLKQGPVSVPQTIVCLAPKTAEAAEPVFAAAHRLGVSDIWIDVPDSSEGLRLLAGCVAAGKAHGVAVGARVSLIHLAPTEASANQKLEDFNLYGETLSAWGADVKREVDSMGADNYHQQTPHIDTRDALAPEAPEVRQRLAAWLQDVAAIPGLAGISLHEAASPGHDWSGESHDYVNWLGTTFGYTVANRLAFLREKGYDPIDFDDLTNEYEDWELSNAIKVPRFDTKGEEDVLGYYERDSDADKPRNAWNAFRATSESEFLNALRGSIAKSHPLLPVFLGSYDSDSENWSTGSYEAWKAGAYTPFSAPPDTQTTKKPPLPVTPPIAATSDLLLHLTVTHDFLSERDDEIKEIKKLDPNLVGLTPGVFVAEYIRASIEESCIERNFSDGVFHKRAKPGPKGIVLDLTTVAPDDVLTLLKGALMPTGK